MTVLLMLTPWNRAMTHPLLPPKLRRLPLRVLRCPALRAPVLVRESRTNAFSAASASYIVTNSWSIRGCTREKTLTSAPSVGKPSGGRQTCPLTDERSAQMQLMFASNVGIVLSLYRKNLDTGVVMASISSTVPSVGKALRKCTC